MTNGLVIRRPDDFHVHLRDGEMLAKVLPDTARHFARALVMPNLHPPVRTGEEAMAYRDRIIALAPGFDPLMTIYLTEKTTPEMIIEAGKVGVKAVKYYPHSGTTNSEYGLYVPGLMQKSDCMGAMQEAGMVFCLHGEYTRVPHLQREQAFVDIVKWIASNFKRLRVVFEHVSTRAALDLVREIPNLAATITLHHLVLLETDWVGNHDNLCMPVAKTEQDRSALLSAVISEHPRIFFGSDSAPHPRTSKNRAEGAFGLYTAPVALAGLAKVFDRMGHVSRLENFVSTFGADFYGLPQNTGEIEIVKETWTVPDPTENPKHDPFKTVLPFWAGSKLNWNVRTP